MTCIVGLVQDGHVWLGGDAASADSEQWTQYPSATPKVRNCRLWLHGELVSAVVGYSTSFRMADILWDMLDRPWLLDEEGGRDKLQLPPVDDYYARGDVPFSNDPVREWLVGLFVPALQHVFRQGEFQKVENEQATAGTFLIGIKGRLFRIQPDYSVLESGHDYDAVGCGEKAALASMFTTGAMAVREPTTRIHLALESAAAHLAYILPPFTIVSA